MRISVVDAFTDRAFAGNPAGVCLLPAAADPAWMQLLAAEMRHAETAFVYRGDDDLFHLRWFTPAAEVSLCGHATLATAHLLHQSGEKGPVRFSTASGILTADFDGEMIVLDFPARPPRPVTVDGLEQALGARPEWTGETDEQDLVAVLASAKEVEELEPDLGALADLAGRGFAVTARGAGSRGGDADFISRFFAPAVGVPEDSVTGSAHCALAPYWSDQLGKSSLTGFQASARGGRVRVDVAGDRVRLGGTAVTILDGELSETATTSWQAGN